MTIWMGRGKARRACIPKSLDAAKKGSLSSAVRMTVNVAADLGTPRREPFGFVMSQSDVRPTLTSTFAKIYLRISTEPGLA